MQILNCDNLISSCCSDYKLARLLSVFSNIVQLIQIIVPIVLILMVVFNIIQMMSNPEEKKITKKLINRIIAAVIVFLLPILVNAILNLIPNSFDITACLRAGKQLDSIAKNDKIIYSTIEEEEKRKPILNNPKKYEKGDPNIYDNNSQNSDTNGNTNGNTGGNISTDGSILLIAGHSYAPYCSTGNLGDCRGVDSNSGYAEEVETRKLVKLIKTNLDNLNVKSDIANAMMAGDNDKMNKSFYIESRLNTDLFNKFNWSKYKFVLEVHFNAANSSAKGTLLCKKSSSYNTPADNDIVNAVIKHTGNKRLGDSIQSLNNISYFSKRNIPIVYLETEFYDNASAMRIYTAHINEIARDIAIAIQKNYG